MEPSDATETPTVTIEQAEERLRSGVRVIDVRETVEWDSARVPGTELRPMSTIGDWYGELDPDEEVLVLCRTGNRSGSVVDALITQAGFTRAYNIAGGVVEWAAADLPLEHGPADNDTP